VERRSRLAVLVGRSGDATPRFSLQKPPSDNPVYQDLGGSIAGSAESEDLLIRQESRHMTHLRLFAADGCNFLIFVPILSQTCVELGANSQLSRRFWRCFFLGCPFWRERFPLPICQLVAERLTARFTTASSATCKKTKAIATRWASPATTARCAPVTLRRLSCSER
jgi:hypothetical protein